MEVEAKVFDRSRPFTRASKGLPAGRKVTEKKKLKGADSELYMSICPIVYVIRVFGLAPYEFHNDMLVPSSVNSIFAYGCLAIYSYLIYGVLSRFTSVERDKPLLGHTETGKAICNYCMVAFDIVWTLIWRSKFAKIWNAMQDYDYFVRNLGYVRNEKQACIWSWLILCTSIVMWTAVNQLGMAAFDERWFDNVAYMIIYVGGSVSIIKFSGFTMLLGQRFDHLNIIAKKSSPTTNRWMLAGPVVDMRDIEYLHNTLMIEAERLNSLYSWPLLLWLGNLCFHVVTDLYFVSQRVMTCPWKFYEWRVLLCLITWILVFIAQLILLNYACDYTSSEANNMGYIMVSWKRWFENSGFSRGRYENLDRYLSLHLNNRRLNFSAAGCFDVNLPRITSIAGLLTTYLVILLQFPE